jgi:hypothetical protein
MAVARRQRANPRVSTVEIDAQERHMPVAPLPPELAERAARDRAEAESRRAEIRRIRREIEERKRAAKKAGNQELLEKLDDFSRRFERAARPPGGLDRFAS